MRCGELVGFPRRGHFFQNQSSMRGPFSPCSHSILTEYILANGPPRDEDWWESASASSCDGSQEEGHQEKELNGDGGKRFRNCGLEAWRQVQQAWRARDPSHTKTQSSKPRPSIKRDLVKSLSGCRQFELPQQLPLKDLISAYNDVWNGSD